VNSKAIKEICSKIAAQGVDVITLIRGLMEKLANP